MKNDNNKKNIVLIFHGRLPSEKASSLFVVEEAQSFAEEGCKVTVLAPRRLGRSKKSIDEYYGIDTKFSVVYLPTIDIFWVLFLKRFAFHVSFVVFSFFTTLYILLKTKKEDCIYSNESLPILLATYLRSNTLYQVHDFPEQKKSFYTKILTRVKHILIITEWKRKQLVVLFGILEEKIHLVRNGVHVEKFTHTPTKEKARKKLGIKADQRLVVYTGHLYSWKGADTLAEAITQVPDVQGYFVGGTEKDVKHYRENFSSFKNIHFMGHVPHDDIPLWQKAADMLAIPNTAKEKISTHYTSPMKLFEYMASGTPIVASRIPSIKEVVGEEDVFFAQPDDPDSFAHIIRQVFWSPDEASARAKKLQANAEYYSWENRAKKILSFLFT